MEERREGGGQSKGGESKAKKGRAEQMRREQNRTEGEESAGEGRGEEGRRGGWKWWCGRGKRDLEKFLSQRTQYASIPMKGKSLAQGLT